MVITWKEALKVWLCFLWYTFIYSLFSVIGLRVLVAIIDKILVTISGNPFSIGYYSYMILKYEYNFLILIAILIPINILAMKKTLKASYEGFHISLIDLTRGSSNEDYIENKA